MAARAGGFHFRADGGHWRDTRSGDDLAVVLAKLLRTQGGLTITLPTLVAPAE